MSYNTIQSPTKIYFKFEKNLTSYLTTLLYRATGITRHFPYKGGHRSLPYI